MNKRIPMKKWGKDHWCLFGYIITRHLDYNGILDRGHLNNPSKEYPTRLKGYFQDKTKCISDYGDGKCLKDFVNEGLIELKEPLETKLTSKGYNVVIELIRHKRNGGNFADFEYRGKNK